MRNRNKINQLGRTTPHRKAMLSNMAASLIEHKRISTTVAKAKALRGFVEPLITKSKDDTTHSRRMAFRHLGNKEAVTELFREVGPKVGDRPGGYTRIIKTGFRQGDSAEMCIIELVDFNDVYTTEKKAKKTRRSRRGSGSSESKAAAPKVEDVVVEEAAVETEEATAEAEATPEVKEEAAEEAVETATEEVAEAEVAEEATEEVKAEAASEEVAEAEAPAEETPSEPEEESADDEEKKEGSNE